MGTLGIPLPPNIAMIVMGQFTNTYHENSLQADHHRNSTEAARSMWGPHDHAAFLLICTSYPISRNWRTMLPALRWLLSWSR